MGIDGNVALADAAAAISAVEYRQMLGFEVRRAFYGHSAAAVIVSGDNLLLRVAERLQQVEIGFGQLRSVSPSLARQNSSPSTYLLKANWISKACARPLSIRASAASSNPFYFNVS